MSMPRIWTLVDAPTPNYQLAIALEVDPNSNQNPSSEGLDLVWIPPDSGVTKIRLVCEIVYIDNDGRLITGQFIKAITKRQVNALLFSPINTLAKFKNIPCFRFVQPGASVAIGYSGRETVIFIEQGQIVIGVRLSRQIKLETGRRGVFGADQCKIGFNPKPDKNPSI